MDFDDRPYELEKLKTEQEMQKYWDMAIGLQKTDGLTPSEYLIYLSKEHVEGRADYTQIIEDLKVYHDSNKTSDRTVEADFSSVRISEILSTDGFVLSPATLLSYHRRLFTGIDGFEHPVGIFRSDNITKPEEVLDWYSVNYADHADILDTIKWEFSEEKEHIGSNMPTSEILTRVTKFIANIWRVHPFREGNTRTIAVFTIKYLRTLGLNSDNTPFKDNSRFFRDALVLYNAPSKLYTDKYLRFFMENTFLNGNHILSTDEMLERTKRLMGGK